MVDHSAAKPLKVKKVRPRTRPRKQRVRADKRGVFRPQFVERAAIACMVGLTDYEIGTIFGVTGITISRWKVEHPEFGDALRTGKIQADERVERALYSRAVGYSFDSEEIHWVKGKPKRIPVVKHVPPDISAARLWLTNRRRDYWRDVQKHEFGKPGAFDHMTREELEASLLQDMITLDLLPAPEPEAASGVAPAPAAGVVPRVPAVARDRKGVE